MSEDPERKKVVELIRACLLCSKGGVCLDQINRDYRDLVGENIPYRKLGHANLADFFSKARDVCRLMESQGRLIVHPVATEATQHIDTLVSQQKKSATGNRGKRGRGTLNHAQYAFGAGRRPNQRSNWVPPMVGQQQSQQGYHNGQRGNRRAAHGNRKVGSGRLPPRSSIANSTYRSYPPNGSAPTKLRTPASKPPSLQSTPATHITNNNSSSQVNNEANGACSNTNSSSSSYPLKIGTFHSGGKTQGTSAPQQQASHYPRSSKPPKNGGSSPSERSYVKDLTQYFKEKNLGQPEFKTSEMGSKKLRQRTYVASVTVEGKSFRTFPEDFHSKELAQEAAARLAVEALGLKEEGSSNAELALVGEFNELIAQRIASIVGDKMNGIWTTQVDVEYKRKYKEVLPNDWPSRIDPAVHHLTISVPIENHYIVLPVKSVVVVVNEEDEGSSNNTSNTSNSKKTTSLPPVILSEEAFWDVYITTVSSPSDVVVRLLNTSHYDDLTTDMELYYYDYSEKLPPVTEPEVGRLYAAKLDSDWHRVRVINVHGIKVTCHFLDHGDEDVLPVTDLRELMSQFLKFPPMAVAVKLAGLEHLPSEEAGLVRESVLGKSLVAEVVSREKGSEPRLILFDTSTETDINLNQKVLEELNGSGGGGGLSPGEEEVSPAFLLSISSNGDCIVQRGSYGSLESLLQEAKESIFGAEEEEETALETNKLYLARNVLSNTLFRASLLTTQVKEGKVEVIFVDHGCQEKVATGDLRLIGSSSKPLAETPPQAFKCRLGNMPENITWTSEAAEKLRSLIPEDKEISIKVLSAGGGSELPLVEMTLKEEESSVNALIAGMNDLFIIQDEAEEGSTQEEENNNNHHDDGEGDKIILSSSFSPQDELLFSEIASLKGLVPPKIPEKDEYFDVTVILAASPSNFFVQPWRQTESLEILTSEINEYYSSPSRRVCSVSLEDLQKDSFFAASHSDGFWYRIKVDRILENQNIAVKFVDYGDFTMVNLKNLQPLWPQFRNLPMQAIKAFLSDIVPVNGDWTPDDAVWFSNRSVDKQFVSVVKDISTEEDGSIKLGVSLIDVSHPKEDILIDKLLVEEKRAAYLCI